MYKDIRRFCSILLLLGALTTLTGCAAFIEGFAQGAVNSLTGSDSCDTSYGESHSRPMTATRTDR